MSSPMDSPTTQVERAADRLAHVINSLGCLQVTNQTLGAKDVSFLCRETDRPLLLMVLEYFLTHERGWKSFFGQKYFMKEVRGVDRLVFGWYLAFKSDDIVSAMERIGGLLIKAKVASRGGIPLGEGTGVVDYKVVSSGVIKKTEPRYTPKGPALGTTQKPALGPDEAPLWLPANRNVPKEGSIKGAKPISYSKE